MKKLSLKLVVSALVAAAMVSVSAVSVSAVDYGGGASPSTNTPTTTTTTGATTTTDTTAAPTATTPAAAVEVVTDKVAEEAIAAATKAGASSVTLYVNEDASGKATVQEAAVAAIAKSTVPVNLVVSTPAGLTYGVTIDPSTVTEPKAINLAMDFFDSAAASAVLGVDVPAGVVAIAPAQKGEFGLTLGVTLPAAALTGVDPSSAALYYVSDLGEISAMPKGSFTVNADQSVTVFISHASAYVLSNINLAALMADYNIEDDVYDDDDYEDDAVVDDDDAEVDADDDFVVDGAEDSNPGTGVTLALGALAASAAAVVMTAKKRK